MWVSLPGNIYHKDGGLKRATFTRHKKILAEKYPDYEPRMVNCPSWAKETAYLLRKKKDDKDATPIQAK